MLLHVSSLPGPYGIGDIGPSAYEWVDWLADAGCRYWQMLPLGPTGYADSPYSSLSSFAGNLNLISPALLAKDGLLAQLEGSAVSERVDYGSVIRQKWEFLQAAHSRLGGELKTEFLEFQGRERDWVEPYSLFMALKSAHGGGSWTSWPSDLRNRESASLSDARRSLVDEIERHAFGQFVFYRQLDALREYATAKGIEIIGDVPLYVASDSVDVWVNPELFAVDPQTGRPLLVAGVPPDMFSAVGQWWGNPLYRWKAHSANDYEWWSSRLAAFLRQADVLRLDHFTGFARYYEIEGDAENAIGGVWREGPGAALFTAAQRRLGGFDLIVEDLGPLGEVVEDLRAQLGYPGMKILQDAFDGPAGNQFLPENYQEDCVVYTGTHDNNTARGRLDGESDAYRSRALSFTGGGPESFAWDLLSRAWDSVAVIAIAPMQDLLGLGSAARMNYPATTEGNWQWRMAEGMATPALGGQLASLNQVTGRTR